MSTSAWRGWCRRIAFWTRTFFGRSQQKVWSMSGDVCPLVAIRMACFTVLDTGQWSTHGKLMKIAHFLITKHQPEILHIRFHSSLLTGKRASYSYQTTCFISFSLTRNRKHPFQAKAPIKKHLQIVWRMALFLMLLIPSLRQATIQNMQISHSHWNLAIKSRLFKGGSKVKPWDRQLWKMIKLNLLNIPTIPTETITISFEKFQTFLFYPFLVRIPPWPEKVASLRKSIVGKWDFLLKWSHFWGCLHVNFRCMVYVTIASRPRKNIWVSQQTRPAALYVSPLPRVPTSNQRRLRSRGGSHIWWNAS